MSSINTENYSVGLPLLAFHMLKYDIKVLQAQTDFFFFSLPSPKRVNHISGHNSLDYTVALGGSGIQKTQIREKTRDILKTVPPISYSADIQTPASEIQLKNATHTIKLVATYCTDSKSERCAVKRGNTSQKHV